ncbi:geranylgeranyl reductase family protein [Aquifex pyrophilus]
MSKYDAVIVGSGPAGSSCGKYLAEKGLKVLIIEKKKLPRFKLCGGALSSRFSKYLPSDFKTKVLNVINRGVLGFRGEKSTVKEKKEVAYIIDRAEFDHYLTQKALSSGAELWEEVEFSGFMEEKGKIIVYTSKGKVEADFLLGADGFYSRISKLLGYKKEKFYRSVELLAEGDMDKESVIIEIGLVKRGYLWIFPKGDLLNIGVASTEKENLNKVLEEYLKKQRNVRLKKVYKLKGWFIPFTESEKDLHLGRGRVLLLGDAGNFVDPLLGEGIYYAYLSGLKAGKAILENPENPVEKYRKEVQDLLSEFIYAGKIAKLAYRFQKVAYRMGAGKSLEKYMELLKGKENYENLYKRGWVDFVRSFILSLFRL